MVQARLGDRLGIDKAALVHNLNGLENLGLVERRNHPDDGRSFIVHLTKRGNTRLQEAERLNATLLNELFEALSTQERETLRELLQRVAKSLDSRA